MGSVIVTLFEGDYVLGAGALVNSLFNHGFRGRVYCGHKGSLLFWAKDALQEGAFRVLRPAEELELRFFPIEHPWHLTNLKPHMMLKVWDECEPDAEAMFYFDPDITIKCRWSFFEEWVGYGLPLVADPAIFPMPSDHPFRMAWSKWLTVHGFQPTRYPNLYFNGGFVGFTSGRRSDLQTWCRLHELMSKAVPLDRMGPVQRTELFCMTDQDAMNMLTMVTPGPLSSMGPEGMDFAPAGVIMSHAAGGAKPWRKPFLRSALAGIPPTPADKNWLANVSAPIPVLSKLRVATLHRQLVLASAIGRLVRRV